MSLRQRLAAIDAQLAPAEGKTDPSSPQAAASAPPGSLAALVDASFPSGTVVGAPSRGDHARPFAVEPELPGRQVER